MDKRQELLKKLDILVQEIDKAKKIVDDDSLASIKALYDAASDVDLFYSRKCQQWQSITFIMFLHKNAHISFKPTITSVIE